MDSIENPCIVPAHWNIYQRVNWVRSQLWYVQKTQVVKGQDYKAVTHDLVTAMLRVHLVKAGVIIVPKLAESRVDEAGSTKTGTQIIRYSAKYSVHFVNADNPADHLSVVLDAHAMDMGDKAPGKAISYATKYAMLKLFNLETGEDEESRIEAQFKPVEHITEAQANEITLRLEDNNIDVPAFSKWLQGPPVKAPSIEEITTAALPIVEREIEKAIKRRSK